MEEQEKGIRRNAHVPRRLGKTKSIGKANSVKDIASNHRIKTDPLKRSAYAGRYAWIRDFAHLKLGIDYLRETQITGKRHANRNS